jgi:excinuclease ABC subunit B
MATAIKEVERRRAIQETYNAKYDITPKSVTRDVTASITNSVQEMIAAASAKTRQSKRLSLLKLRQAGQTTSAKHAELIELEVAMKQAAEALDFERAIALRERWYALKKELAS